MRTARTTYKSKIIEVKMIKSGSMPALPQARDFDFNRFDFLL